MLHNRILWRCRRRQQQQQQQFGYTGLKRQLNESDCLANQRIYLAFISFNPPSLIRLLWLCSNVHPVQVQTASNHSLWWGHPSMQHKAQSWIGTVWSKFGTGRQRSYSKAGTWLSQSVPSQVWALDGIIKAGVHKNNRPSKEYLDHPTALGRRTAVYQKEGLLFGKRLIGCGEVPCMAETSREGKAKKKGKLRESG